MAHKLAIDFGTTNTVVARWNEQQQLCEVLALPGMSILPHGSQQLQNTGTVIPSLVFVHNGQSRKVSVGYEVQKANLECMPGNRLFRSFKRAILSGRKTERRLIDGVQWSEHLAGEQFLRAVLNALPYRFDEIEQLVLTVPVVSFDSYLSWISEALPDISLEKIRIIDESTAAALGYAVTEPGAIVLVFDFGGGSLDLSLVELPQSRSSTGGILSNLLGKNNIQRKARVIAKAGLALGGSDVDHWLLNYVLEQAGLGSQELGDDFPGLLSACEQAKIALSFAESETVLFQASGQTHRVIVHRTAFDALLAQNGYYALIRDTLDRALHGAQRRGIYREDVDAVLLVGGASLMPSVQHTVCEYFREARVHIEKPFSAVAEGALQVAIGMGIEDHLLHGYGLRCLDRRSQLQTYEEIIPMGSRYPFEKPVKILLEAAYPNQRAIELVIGEIESGAVGEIQVHYENGQTVFLADASQGSKPIRPINLDKAAESLVQLKPAGQPGRERLQVEFSLDMLRQVHVTVTDLRSHKILLKNVLLARLEEAAGERGVYLLRPEDNLIKLDESGDVAAQISEQMRKMHNRNLGLFETPQNAADAVLSGCEPRLAARYSETGRFHLSLRGLSTLLNSLPAQAVPIEVSVQALNSPEFYVRYSAAEALSKRGDPEARQALQAVLHTGTPPQRASVAANLHHLSWFTAEPMFRQILHDPDRRVREGAVYALCKLHSIESDQLLLEILPGEEDLVLLAVVWGVSVHPDMRWVPVLEITYQSKDLETRIKTLEMLGDTGASQALPLVRRALDASNLDEKYAAVLSYLELAGEAAIPDIIERIQISGGSTCAAYLRGFFHATNYLQIDVARCVQIETVQTALEKASRDPNPETRLIAVMSLAWLHTPACNQALQTAFERETQPAVKARLLYLAVSLMSPVRAALLDAGLRDAQPEVREMAQYLR